MEYYYIVTVLILLQLYFAATRLHGTRYLTLKLITDMEPTCCVFHKDSKRTNQILI